MLEYLLILYVLLTGMAEERKEFKPTWGKPSWFEAVQEEYWACKERVCLIDMSSFAKFEIKVI